MIRILILGVALWASSCVLAQTPTAPPARPANETFFGTEVPDPYRWLEDVKSPEVAAWMKSHSDYTMSLLARIPGRKTMFDRNVKYEEAVPSRVKQVARETGDRWFLERRGASQNQFKLLMRQGLRGEDRVLVDPEAVEKRTGKPHAINYYSASPGGAFVAYGLSAQGSEAAVLHVLDTRTGKAVGKSIDRADFAAVSFSPDSRTLFFNRLQEL
ncbi:MAG: S9 family peptidase, partial [Pseudomonadota bacterium]|nr:S9 family peptidase [Pseudomonadota bacterium]